MHDYIFWPFILNNPIYKFDCFNASYFMTIYIVHFFVTRFQFFSTRTSPPSKYKNILKF